jgi:hypothetical protein
LTISAPYPPTTAAGRGGISRAVVLGAPGLEPGGRLWPQEEAVAQVWGLPPR